METAMMKKTLSPLTMVTIAGLLILPLAAASATPAWKNAAEGTIALKSFDFVKKISKRNPATPATEFPADGKKVYAYLRVMNKGPRRELRLVWKRDGKPFHTTRVSVGRSRGWRTWGYIRAGRWSVGNWTVTIKDPDNNVLAAKGFKVIKK
jgi:hypothetical protein